ncbi:MAG: OmpH family outer membrane protein [Candidatus Hydrogenedentes bacterium]|nr:OmpH family outer membrane protein [Candidatus Hydrogenedentota bacterium]
MRSLTAVFANACLALLLLSCSNAAVAEDAKPATSSGDYKIGVINRKVIMDGYKKVKAEYETLGAEVKSRQSKIDEISTKIENAKKAYEAAKDKLSAAERAERETAIQNDYRDYQAKLASNQADIDTKEKTMMKTVFAEIDEVVDRIGADESYGPHGRRVFRSKARHVAESNRCAEQ